MPRARPIFRISDFVAQAGIPGPTARRVLKVLRKAGILKELIPARGRRSGVLLFPDLLKMVEGNEIF